MTRYADQRLRGLVPVLTLRPQLHFRLLQDRQYRCSADPAFLGYFSRSLSGFIAHHNLVTESLCDPATTIPGRRFDAATGRRWERVTGVDPQLSEDY